MARVERPWAERRKAIKGHLDRAREFARRIEDGDVESAAELSRLEGMTRARVCQLLRLLKLSAAVLADIDDVESDAPMLQEKALRKLVGITDAGEQVATYTALLAEEAVPRRAGRSGARPQGRVRRRGLQHLFEQARRYAAMLESGEARSYAEIGRWEGISGARVGQIVLLLHLVPEILAVVDVPAEELPVGVTERRLRVVARAKGREEQLRAWDKLIQAREDSGIRYSPDAASEENRCPIPSSAKASSSRTCCST